jgi:signal transduction histidine kinase
MKDKHLLFYIILGSVAVESLLVSMHTFSINFVWEYEPLHSAIEVFGAMAALFMAVILLQRRQEGGEGRIFWLAQGLLSMGLINAFHAITRVGRGFILLHSLATVVGSFCFVLVWLPESYIYEPVKKWITGLVITVSMLFGVLVLLFRQTLPVMVQEGKFTTPTIAINLLAGMFFIVATVRFLLELHRCGKSEFYFFSSLSLLLGLAALMYPLSRPWDDLWWFWHLQHLLVYLIVAWFVVYKYLQSVSDLRVTIAERKKAEEKLRDAYNKLKETETQLIQSGKMASIGELASGVAHEINNPLTGVLNSVQLIKDKIEQSRDFNFEDFKKILDNIEESATRCKTIILSLLNFSRSSRGPFSLLPLNEIIEKVTVLIGREMQLEKINLEKQFQIDLPQILGDAQLLQQVIFNLLSNARWAIQESKKKGGIITVKTRYEPEKSTVLLSISDNGIGIPKENLGKIFEPFFTTRRVGEGTGLGLSIVYSIIKKHEGSIEVESQAGKGTTFKISLPCILEKAKI